MVKKIYIFLFVLTLVFSNCFKEKPSQYDGVLTLIIYSEFEGKIIPFVPVTLETNDYNISTVAGITDSSGMVIFNDLPWAYYQVSGKSTIIAPSPHDSTKMDTFSVNGSEFISIDEDNLKIDTLNLIVSGAEPGLKINELYIGGAPCHSYWYDQYFELYNSSEDTVYLDGIVICRMGKMLANITYIFQFPGEPLTGKEYPVPPDSFVVLAIDAYDHTEYCSESIDLSNADWEFRNSMDYGDFDNPDVPNIENIEVGHHLDFLPSLGSDVILIADGSDVDYLDGMDIESVIDCVEYSSNPEHIKEIESELDRGFAGVGKEKYSGQSLERIAPGFDTNNSTLDFEIIPHPTPGYQHE